MTEISFLINSIIKGVFIEDTHSNEILSNAERIAFIKAIQEKKSPPHKMEITPEMKKAIFNFLNLP